MEETDVDVNKNMMEVDPNDRFRKAKINALEVKRQKDINTVEFIKMQETKSKKRNSIKKFDNRLTGTNQVEKVNRNKTADKKMSQRRRKKVFPLVSKKSYIGLKCKSRRLF